MPLIELENFIRKNKHLPEIPSASKMSKEGLAIKQINILLLKKIEELTLHQIQLYKKIEELQNGQWKE